MTEQYEPFPPTSAGASTGSGSDQSTTDVAKEQASNVTQGTKEAGQHVAGVAKDQAANVTAEAGRQAKDLLHQARSELTDQAGTQQQRVAEGLRSLSQELHGMSRNSEQSGVATDLAKQGAQLTEQAASWFNDREPAALLNDVRSFARQRPGAFLLLAAGAGLLAGRLTRGLKDDASSSSDGGQAGGYSNPTYSGGYQASGSYSGDRYQGSYTGAGASDTSAGGYSGSGAGSLAGAPMTEEPTALQSPVTDPGLDEPVPYAGRDGELGYPTPGRDR